MIARLDEPPRTKLRHVGDAIAVAGYYLADFSKTGSTAEHRVRQG